MEFPIGTEINDGNDEAFPVNSPHVRGEVDSKP
jgi:hypothetical protein